MKRLLLITALTATSILIAQEETQEESPKKFSISGSVDTYFKSNLTGPNEAFTDEDENAFYLTPGTSFANRSGFSIGMANAILSYEGDKVGFVADLVFGPRGEDAVFLSVGSSNIVNQLYAYWNVSDKVTVTIGNFNTFLGYEVISPVGNFNYSTSYMFSYGPFSHTGVKVDLSASEDLSIMLAVMNSTDYTEFNLDGSYTLGGQIGFKDQFLNLIYGEQTGTSGTTFQIDYTGGTDLTESFFLGVNATYNDTDGAGFYGVALYPQYKVSDVVTIGARGEYFAEMEGGAGAIGAYDENGDASIFDITLTANVEIKDLTLKPELRIDAASEDTFLDNDLAPMSSLASILVAAIYKF